MSTKGLESVDTFKLYLTAFVANLGSFLFGFDFGAVSWLLISFTTLSTSADDDSSYFTYIVNNSAMVGFIACGSAIGAAFTYLLLLFFGNGFAKHYEIRLSAVLYFLGAMFESTSGLLNWNSPTGLYILIAGRLVYGGGVAASFHSVPQYISELGPAELRGMVGSATEAMIVTGIVVGYLVGYFYQADQGWVVTFRVSYIVAAIMLIASLYLPRSAFWLAKNRASKEEILEALLFIYPNASQDSVDETLRKCEEQERENKLWENKLILVQSETNRDSSCSRLNECFFRCLTTELSFLFYDPTLSRCLLFAIALVVLQMMTGQAAILYFAGTVFDSLCPANPDLCIMGLGITKLLAAYSMLLIGDLLGRRTFLIGGSAILTIGNIILVLGVYYSNSTVSLTGIYTTVVGFEVSFGCMLWVLLSEIFPQFVRSAANAISVMTLFLFMALVTFTLPIIVDYLDLMFLFVIYTLFSALSVFMFIFFAPETRGADLETAYQLMDVTCDQSFSLCGCGAVKKTSHDSSEAEDFVLPSGSYQSTDQEGRRRDPLLETDDEDWNSPNNNNNPNRTSSVHSRSYQKYSKTNKHPNI